MQAEAHVVVAHYRLYASAMTLHACTRSLTDVHRCQLLMGDAGVDDVESILDQLLCVPLVLLVASTKSSPCESVPTPLASIKDI